VAKEDRGFASMDRAKQREIASKGGKAAHQKGTAHEWTSEASHRRRREMMQQGGGEDAAATRENTGDESGTQNRERSSSMTREDRMSDFAGNDRESSER
jgi:hypothetical protein